MSNKLFLVGETLSVEIKLGSITAETSDAIVNLNNVTLNRNNGVSKQILAAAGPTVQQECAQSRNVTKGDAVVTGPGNLKCKKIIHLVAVRPHRIVSCVKKALKACDEHNLRVLSLPAIGTGRSNLDPQSSIKAIMRGIEEYIFDPTTITSISEIILVAFNQDVQQEYAKFFQNYETNYSQFTAFGKAIELIKGDITDHYADCIVNLTNWTLDRTTGVSGAILAAAGDKVKGECKIIGTMNHSHGVLTSGGKTKARKILHIIGPSVVDEFGPKMDKILQVCHRKGYKSVAVPAIGTGVKCIGAEESMTAILESILNHLASTHIPSLETITVVAYQESIYKTFLKVFQKKSDEVQEMQREENILRGIQALVVIDYPSTWKNPGENYYEEVSVDKHSAEYKEVAEKFLTSSEGPYEVSEIIRIQNKKLWQSFSLNKQDIDQKVATLQTVRRLYHGTSVDRISNISRRGFNRAYCGVHGIARGAGTYFAVKASYSCQDRYSAPDSKGLKRIYQAAVITGRYCVGDHTLKEPPFINNNPNGDRYDSTVDNIPNTTYFVTFHDDYAYPEYLITFSARSS